MARANILRLMRKFRTLLYFVIFPVLFALVLCGITSGQTDFNCWDWGHQCHGDADGAQEQIGKNWYWVGYNDLGILNDVMNSGDRPALYPESSNYNPAADFDRDFDVDIVDQNILEAYWMHPVPNDCPKKLELLPLDCNCIVADSNFGIEWEWRKTFDIGGHNDHPGMLYLYYSLDYGNNWTFIDSLYNALSYDWDVPSEIRTHLDLKIIDVNHFGLEDVKYWSVSCESAPPGDNNGDCYVDFADYAIQAAISGDVNDVSGVVSDWLKCGNPCDPCCTY